MTDARVTQEAVLVLHGGVTSDARVTQEAGLVLHGGVTSDARVSQEAIKVLHSGETSDARVSQVAIKVLSVYVPPGPVKIAHAPVNVLTNEPSEVKITHAPVHVLTNELSEVKIAHAPVHVLITDPLITTSEEAGNYPIYALSTDSSTIEYINGTWNYTVLLGADTYTATFKQAGTTTFTDGVATIAIDEGSAGDPVILVIQKDTYIGVYNAVISRNLGDGKWLY